MATTRLPPCHDGIGALGPEEADQLVQQLYGKIAWGCWPATTHKELSETIAAVNCLLMVEGTLHDIVPPGYIAGILGDKIIIRPH